jgi:hypothetical protein
MKIVVNADIGDDDDAKRKLVAEVCRGVDKFLTTREPFELHFANDVALTDLSSTLYSLAELVTNIAGMVKNKASDDEDYDPADFWKK